MPPGVFTDNTSLDSRGRIGIESFSSFDNKLTPLSSTRIFFTNRNLASFSFTSFCKKRLSRLNSANPLHYIFHLELSTYFILLVLGSQFHFQFPIHFFCLCLNFAVISLFHSLFVYHFLTESHISIVQL